MKFKNLFNILKVLPLFLLIISCGSEEVNDGPIIIPVAKVQAAFNMSISSTDPNVLLLDNRTVGTGDFTSKWDFGKGGSFVLDQPGIEEVRYDTDGTFSVRLIVENSAGLTVDAKTVIVDSKSGGICPNGVCGSTNSSILKDAAATFFVGNITRSSRVNSGGKHTELLKTYFSSITSEYEMKMDRMHPSEGNFDFTAADAIVNFGVENGINVHGHALIWHNATPDWVKNFSGSDAEFEVMVKNYIVTTVTRYKGKIASWDVVNEAIDDGSGNPLRNSIFKQKMGDDYIKKCYQWAREADPDCLLFYNDYNMASTPSKRAAMFKIVDSLGDLIDGVGAQMHINYNFPSKANIQAVADGTVSRGLKLHFAELDIRANPDNNQTSLTAERANLQKAKFAEVVKIYNSIPLENKYALTVWGLRDNETWLTDFWGHIDWPLMFNEDYSKKPAYDGFIEGLQ
ncbi:endo-1,4-beta-xylanase [Polaribacter sp. PL03]|uniref:endo-1,4-beta-xylanase n=1 Tax=Polaribacter sp. PL03 TaxID=3088353 RepID=UPI0029CD9C3B|nr:endo-1,4-beta-xylanase [Polaribacter sp. PL03]MDX6746615.1 endo-1,4-beta-xylanase [Polaribacter sp. PL03]